MMYCCYIRNLGSASLTVCTWAELHLFPDFLLGGLPVGFKPLRNQRFLRLLASLAPAGGIRSELGGRGERETEESLIQQGSQLSELERPFRLITLEQCRAFWS